jgi:SAM-dependent methyltransferase
MFEAFKSMMPGGMRKRLGWARRRTSIGMSVEPVSRIFGLDRGVPIDRHYIESFLQSRAEDIRGDVLEISDNAYTRRFGADKVTKSHVLSVDPKNPDATIIGDLVKIDSLPTGAMDCIICTQTLQFIFDVRQAVKSLHRMLRPGGVVLITVPGITQVARYDMDNWGEYWRFTTLCIRRLLAEEFGEDAVEVAAHGNVLTSAAMLYGVAVCDLRPEELARVDRDYEMLITARAVRRR